MSVSNFYLELLRWWAEFRTTFSDVSYSQNVVWNNKDIRINSKPVFYKIFFDRGIIFLNDLQFDVDNVRSYESIKQKGLGTNFLTWTALRSAIINVNSKSPGNLLTVGNLDPMNFEYNAKVFNAYVCKYKQIYSMHMLISTKAKTPNSFKKLIADFKVTSETYVWSFQYSMLNFILFTKDPVVDEFHPGLHLTLERLSMTLRQTANGKNETFAVCLELYVWYRENIFICGE